MYRFETNLEDLGGDQRGDAQPDVDHLLRMRLWTTPEQRPTGFFQTKGVSNFFVQCSGAGALICGICECEDPHYGERYADGDPDDLGGKEA